jgi:WD40 repeat protein
MNRLCTTLLVLALPAGAQDFARDIYPIFTKNCTGCHATATTMGGLDLSSWEGLQKGGAKGPIVAPGKSAESRLYHLLTGDAKPQMPMGAPKLPAGEIDLVRKWIDSGAARGSTPLPAVSSAPSIKPRKPVKPQIFSLAWSPDGTTVAVGGYQEVRLLNPASNAAIATLSGHAEVVRAVAFSPDGKLLAAAGGIAGRKGEVKIWNLEQRKPVATIEGHGDTIYGLAISPDGKTLATSSYDKLIKLWDLTSGKEIRTLKDHIDAVYALKFTPDGNRIASGAADRTIKVWDINTGERLYTISDAADGVNTIALDPQGKLIAAGGLDKTIRIWSLADKSARLLHTLIAHEDVILKLAWSPDGKTLVSSSADKSIKIFRAADLTELKSIPAQPDWVYGVEFAPDGKSFAAGRYDGSLSIYELQKLTTDVRTASR